MAIKNKVVRNASWIIVCRIAQAVINLVISMITARYLGPSNYGVISYAASVVAFVLPIACLGLDNILVHETVRNPHEEGVIFGTALIMSFCSSIMCMVGVTVFVTLVNAGEKEIIFVCALYSVLLVFQALEIIQYWFQARFQSKYVSVISLCAYVIVSAYKIFLLATGKSVYWFAVSNAIDHMLIATALIITYRKLGGEMLRFSASVARRMFQKSRYYIMPGLMVAIFAQTDKIMLKFMIDSSATGYYTAAVTCAGMTSFIVSAVIDSMRPAILQAHTESKENFRLNMRRLYSMIIYFALAQSVVMTVFPKTIVFILYGKAYLPAAEILQLIVWYTTFSYMGAVRNVWILAEEKQKYLWIINLSGAIINVALNALLIPIWGANGAAFASLVTQIFTNFVLGFIIKPMRENNRIMLESLDAGKIYLDVKRLLKK